MRRASENGTKEQSSAEIVASAKHHVFDRSYRNYGSIARKGACKKAADIR